MFSERLYLTVHGIGVPTVGGVDLESEMWISTDLFQAILELITPEVGLTFDDGFASCWDIAFPAMRERAIPGKFFVTTGKLDTRGFLSREQVKELSAAGMTIGSHGMRHRPWRRLDAKGLQEEVIDAKSDLESLLAMPIYEAACPFGAYDRKAISALRGSGIRKIYTSDRAMAKSASGVIPRYTIRRSDTRAYLTELINGQHDVSALGRAKMLLKRYR